MNKRLTLNIKFYSYRLISILLVGPIIICTNSWAADTKKTSRNIQLPSPVVTPPEIHDSDYLQGRRFEDRFLNLGKAFGLVHDKVNAIAHNSLR